MFSRCAFERERLLGSLTMLTGKPYFNIPPYQSEEEIYETLSRIL